MQERPTELNEFHERVRVRFGAPSLRLENHASLKDESDVLALIQQNPLFAHLVLDIPEAERAHSRSSETRFQALVMATSDVLYRMDPDWSQMWVLDGRGLLADTGTADPDWMQNYIPVREQAKVRAAMARAIAARDVFELEHQVLRVDGTEGCVLSRAVPIFGDNAEIIEWFGAALDLTARKQAEDDLRTADRRKDEFLATLAHELRNPLAPLRNGLHLARRATPDGPLSATFEMMDRQLRMLVHLVDDLLDIGRIHTGKIRIRSERLILQDVVQASLEAAQSAVDACGHTLRVNLSQVRLEVAGDFDRLTQVFSNLLSNAVKYTERGGTIELHVAREHDDAVVSVMDTGIGIAAEDAQGIFDLFTQIDAHRAHAEGGLGIGLSLVRQLVELHGGSVAVSSAGTGHGSTFTVRLPLAT